MGDQDVNLLVKVVDRASAQLKQIDANLAAIGFTVSKMADATQQSSQKSFNALVALNQGLELARKGFELLKTAAELPIKQFTALFNASASLVKAYDDQFQADIRLTEAARASGNASSEQVKELQKLDQALEQTTRFQAEAIEEGQGFALQLGATFEVMPKVTEAALALASATGDSVVQAFEKMSRAASTGTLLIGRIPVQIKTTGDRVQDFDAVASKVLSTFSNATQRLAQGGAGPLVILQHAFEDVQKALGKIIAESPQFQGFVQTLTDGLKELAEFVAKNKGEFASLFGNLFVASLNVAIAAADTLFKTLTAVAGAAFKVVDALAKVPGLGISSPLVDAEKKVSDTAEQLKQAQAAKQIAIESRGGFVNQDAIDSIPRLTEALKQANAELQKVKDERAFVDMKAQLDAASSSFEGILEKFKSGNLIFSDSNSFLKAYEVRTNAAADAQAALATQVDDFGRKGPDALQVVVEKLKLFLGGSKDAAYQIAIIQQDIKDFAGAGQTQIDFVAKDIERLGKSGAITSSEVERLLDILKNGGDRATQSLQKADQQLKQFGQDAKGVQLGVPGTPAPTPTSGGVGGSAPTSGASAPATQSPIAALSEAARQLSEAAAAVAAKLEAAAASFAEPVSDLKVVAASFKQDADLLADASDGLAESAARTAAGAAAMAFAASEIDKNVKRSANALITAANDLVDASGLLDKSGRRGTFPQLGLGGVVTKETIATVGDRPEVVVPLDQRGLDFAARLLDRANVKGGGQSVTLNVSVGSIELSEKGVDDLMQRVEKRLADRALETVRRR